MIKKDRYEVSGSGITWFCPVCRKIHKDQSKHFGKCDNCKKEK